MKFDVNVIRSHTESVHDYINEPSKAREAFKKNRAKYIINKSILN